jgi:hypothetical protein
MKSIKLRIVCLTIFSFLIFLSLSNIIVAQNYNVNIVVGQGEYRIYQCNHDPSEIGDGWTNIIEFSMETNESVEFFFINEAGNSEFLVNKNFDDISLSNIYAQDRLDTDSYFERNIYTLGVSTVYLIVNNIGDTNASWNIIINILTDYNPAIFIPGYSILFIGIITVITGVFLLKRTNKFTFLYLHNNKLNNIRF